MLFLLADGLISLQTGQSHSKFMPVSLFWEFKVERSVHIQGPGCQSLQVLGVVLHINDSKFAYFYTS